MNRAENFSYEGLNALFEYLEEYEDSCDVVIELDVIALCCDYREDSLETILKEYSIESIEDLRNSTQVIEVDETTVIIQAF
jgi:hypothetical protein